MCRGRRPVLVGFVGGAVAGVGEGLGGVLSAVVCVTIFPGRPGRRGGGEMSSSRVVVAFWIIGVCFTSYFWIVVAVGVGSWGGYLIDGSESIVRCCGGDCIIRRIERGFIRFKCTLTPCFWPIHVTT